jgi:hypothetical protein
MEQLLETITLDTEESNELLFRVKVEGVDQAPAKVRLVCESGDIAYMFNGLSAGDDGLIQFTLPVMKDKLKEGVYQSRVEVLVENRYFAPVQFQINFKKAVTVVAEAVQIPQRRIVPQVTVTASAPVIVAKKSAPVTVEKQIVQRDSVVERPIVTPQQAKKTNVIQPSLKQKYASKRRCGYNERAAGEDLIKELARSFVRG